MQKRVGYLEKLTFAFWDFTLYSKSFWFLTSATIRNTRSGNNEVYLHTICLLFNNTHRLYYVIFCFVRGRIIHSVVQHDP